VFNRKPDPKFAGAEPLHGRSVDNSEAQESPAARAGWPPAPTESVIGSDLSIEGQSITVRCKGSLRVNGNIQADLHSMQLTVGEEAVISGSIAADTVEVYGKVHGAVRASRVVLYASAEVEGDIQSQFLSIEEGASFDGRSRKVNDPQEIAPQLTSSPVRSAPARAEPTVQQIKPVEQIQPVHQIHKAIQLS
jgi:cytoskeletal protein CcmA (bactofilin family)